MNDSFFITLFGNGVLSLAGKNHQIMHVEYMLEHMLYGHSYFT
jgi:hypothetical protein